VLTFTPFPALASGMGSGEYFGGTNDKTLAVAAEARPKLLATTSSGAECHCERSEAISIARFLGCSIAFLRAVDEKSPAESRAFVIVET